jgi:hypothetical protein
MNNTVRNILAALIGLVGGMLIGSLLNMGVLMISNFVIPFPEGVNPSDGTSIKNSIHLFETKHYIMPFLAHALGTLIGVFVAFKIIQIFRAPKFIASGIALVIALLFLWGGLATSKSINSPETPMLVDAVLCYIPMAIIGYWLALRSSPKRG